MDGAPGVPVIFRQEKSEEQDNVTIQHLSMVVQHVLDLQLMKVHVQVQFKESINWLVQGQTQSCPNRKKYRIVD